MKPCVLALAGATLCLVVGCMDPEVRSQAEDSDHEVAAFTVNARYLAAPNLMDRPVVFTGVENPDALLNNGQLGHRLFGYPRVGAQQIIQWTADWILCGGDSLGKPTHFEVRDGKF